MEILQLTQKLLKQSWLDRFLPVMEHKLSLKIQSLIPEALWMVFYRPECIIYRLNVIPRTKTAMYSQLFLARYVIKNV